MLPHAERLAMAKALQAIPPKADLPGQKFKRGQRVHVCKDMPLWMSHFGGDFDAIVQYTYAQKYHGDDIDSYSVIILDATGKPINSVAWYNEYQLTLLDEDTKPGMEIIKAWGED